MKSDNRNALLCDIYDFQYGTGNTIDNIGGEYAIYGSNGPVGFTNIFNSEDAPVIGHIGAYAGIVNWASGKHFVTYNGVICKIKNEINPKYGYYVLLNSKLQNRLRGSTQPFISYDLLNDVKVYLPEREIQDKIASVLSALDAKIELNNRINAELEAMAKTLYDYWFVQFDFPDADGRPYKSSGGKMVWNEVLRREVPEGWEVTTVGDLLMKYSDKSIRIESKEILNNGKYPVITQENGPFIAGFTNEETPINDLPVIVFGDHSCTLRYIDFPFFRGADGTQLMYFDKEANIYMFLFLQSIIHQITGYGKYERHYKYLKEFKVVVPSVNYLDLFQNIANPIFEKISKSRFQNQTLTELRDWLLPMLMNGQVKVSEL